MSFDAHVYISNVRGNTIAWDGLTINSRFQEMAYLSHKMNFSPMGLTRFGGFLVVFYGEKWAKISKLLILLTFLKMKIILIGFFPRVYRFSGIFRRREALKIY